MNDQINPYASPQAEDTPEVSARELALRQLRGPSLGLLFLTGVFLSLVSIVIVGSIAVMSLSDGIPKPRITIGDFFMLMAFPVQVAILCASWQMRRLRSLWFCRIMAIIGCVPGLSPFGFLGIPFGIWATVVLFREDVASQFDLPEE